jgi:hypothetical protein
MMRNACRLRNGAVAIVVFLPGIMALAARAQIAGEPLFAAPFMVEHHVVQTEPDGAASATEPVTDHYGGSWIVSVRPDGSRLVVDFARREVTEVRPAASTYSTIGFERLAELNDRLRVASTPQRSSGPTSGHNAEGRGNAAAGPSILVQRLPDGPGAPPSVRAARAMNQGVTRLKVTGGAESDSIEVWCDQRFRLSERARTALAELEADVLSGGSPRPAGPAALLTAARGFADGAVPVRTIRKVGAGGGVRTIEDVATRLEKIERFPMNLVTVPDGYRRVPHPLEVMVAFVEEEAARTQQSQAGH